MATSSIYDVLSKCSLSVGKKPKSSIAKECKPEEQVSPGVPPSSSSQSFSFITAASTRQEDTVIGYYCNYPALNNNTKMRNTTAHVQVPILLTFETLKDRTSIVQSGVIAPTPTLKMAQEAQKMLATVGDGEKEAEAKIRRTTEEKENDNSEDDNDSKSNDTNDGEDLWSSELATLGQEEISVDKFQGEIIFQCAATTSASAKDVMNISSLDTAVCTIAVESVTIVSTTLVDEVDKTTSTPEYIYGILFDLDVFLSFTSDTNNSELSSSSSEFSENITSFHLNIDLRLVIYNHLTNKISNEHSYPQQNYHHNNHHHGGESEQQQEQTLLQALLLAPTSSSWCLLQDNNILPSYSIVNPKLSSTNASVPIHIVPAFIISTQYVTKPGFNAGATLVSIQVRHSNLHKNTLVITNLTLHGDRSLLVPSQSATASATSSSSVISSTFYPSYASSSSAIMNMSNQLKWTFLKGTEFHFPFLLQPHETFSSILNIDAFDYMKQRSFHSLIDISGYVVQDTKSSDLSPSGASSNDQNFPSTMDQDQIINLLNTSMRNKKIETIRAFAIATWTSRAIASAGTDALKVDIVTSQPSCRMGQQFSITLTITNFGNHAKNLILFLDEQKNVEDANMTNPIQERGISNMSGVIFVQQHATNSSGTGKPWSGGTLFPMGLLPTLKNSTLGEVKEKSSVEVNLPFIALQEGIWNIPQINLFDRSSGELYACIHNLQILCFLD